MILHISFLAAICLLTLGCAVTQPLTREIDTRDEMHNTLREQLQLLPDRDAVVDFLTSEGFDCEFVDNGAFDDRIGPVKNEHDPAEYVGGIIGDTRTPRMFKNQDYVLGRRTDEFVWPAVQKWSVAIVISPTGSPNDVYVARQIVK